MAESDVVKIEQRLQEAPRFLFFPIDEALAFGFPLMLGLLTRHLVLGASIGFIFWQAWKRVKGDGGLQWITGAIYWFFPKQMSPYRSLPDSATELWRG